MKRNSFIIAWTLILVLFLFSCFTGTHIKGSRIDEVAVKKIEAGKTTRSDILKMFGAPERIIDAGGVVTSKSAVTGDVNIASKQEVVVGKNQEIYIYEYEEEAVTTYIFYYVGSKRKEVKKNTLMIWIDKDTGIVQDYGYKKEIE